MVLVSVRKRPNFSPPLMGGGWGEGDKICGINRFPLSHQVEGEKSQFPDGNSIAWLPRSGWCKSVCACVWESREILSVPSVPARRSDTVRRRGH